MSGPLSFTHWSWSFYSWLWLAQTPLRLVYRLYGLLTDWELNSAHTSFSYDFSISMAFPSSTILNTWTILSPEGLVLTKKNCFIFWNLCERSVINTSQWWLSHPRTFLPQLSSLHLIKYNLARYPGSSCEIRVRNA